LGTPRGRYDEYSSKVFPQEEGIMNIAARFSLSKKPRYVDQERKKSIL
jgi:hypothetical protein